MEKVQKPAGLIRFDSFNGIKEGKKLKFSGRLIGYTLVLTVLIGLLSFLLISRADIETTVLRVPGQMFQKTDEGNISNLYNMQVINKTFNAIELQIKVLYPEGAKISRVGEASTSVPANGMVEGVYFVEVSGDQILKTKTQIVIGVYSGSQLLEKVKTNFLGPSK
jgi:hypothetical protein